MSNQCDARAASIAKLKKKISEFPNDPRVPQWRSSLQSIQASSSYTPYKKDKKKWEPRNRTPDQIAVENRLKKLEQVALMSYDKQPRGAIHQKPNKIKGHRDGSVADDRDIKLSVLKSLVYPEKYQARLCDELTQPTGYYHEVTEVVITANMDNTENSGKGSTAWKPILGSSDTLNHYRGLLVDTSNGWPSSLEAFSNKNTYLKETNGTSLAYDSPSRSLVQNNCGYYVSTLTQNIGGTSLQYDAFSLQKTENNVTPSNYGNLELGWRSIPNGVYYSPVANASITILGPATGNTATAYNFIDTWSVPDGVYAIHPIINVSGNFLNAIPPNQTSGTLALLAFDNNNKIVGSYNNNSGVNDLFFGVLNQDNVQVLNDWDGTVYNANQGLVFDIVINVKLYSKYTYQWVWGRVNGAGNITNVITGMTITSTCSDTLTSISDTGDVIKIRPVAMSALFTNILPALNAGGNIVAYSAPSGDIDNYYIKVSQSMGSLQDWQNLARINKGTLIYDGNFKDGAYVWTQPWDKDDTLMRTPSESLDYKYQGLIISWQVSPSNNFTGIYAVARLRVNTTFEYTTDNRLYEQISFIGTTAQLDWILGYLAQFQHASANNKHLENLKRLIKEAAAFAHMAIPYVIKALEVGQTVAAAVL